MQSWLNSGWGGRTRTPECQDQNLMSYHLTTPQQKMSINGRLLRGNQTLARRDTRRCCFPLAPCARPLRDSFRPAPHWERRLDRMRCMRSSRLRAYRSARPAPVSTIDLHPFRGVAFGRCPLHGGGGGDVGLVRPLSGFVPARGSPPEKFQFPAFREPELRTRLNPCPDICRTGRLPSRSWRRVRPRGRGAFA